MAIDWDKALNPANGGPGEAPGYQETVKRIKERGPKPRPSKKKSSKPKRRRTK